MENQKNKTLNHRGYKRVKCAKCHCEFYLKNLSWSGICWVCSPREIVSEKRCGKCGDILMIDKFHKSRKSPDGHQACCAKCNLINANVRYPSLNVEKRRQQSRATALKSKYGISLYEYSQMLLSQNNVCAICKRQETSRSNSKGPIDSLRVDHCHKTNKIRGLLCSECNFGISKFDDNIDFLYSAIEYLKNNI